MFNLYLIFTKHKEVQSISWQLLHLLTKIIEILMHLVVGKKSSSFSSSSSNYQ